MRPKAILPFIATGLALFNGQVPALAQIYGPSQGQPQQAATTGTVPGIYYDPSGELSPSFSQMPTSEQPGAFNLPAQYRAKTYQQLGFDPSRAWSKGSTPDQILKIGDLQQSKYLSPIGKLSLREIAARSGQSLESVPLSQVGYVSGMSVAELYQAYPQMQNLLLKDVPFLAQAFAGAAQAPGEIGRQQISDASQRALSDLTGIDPRFANVPVGSILRGDWDRVLSQSKATAAKAAAQELTKINPALANAPVSEILDGNWKGAGRALLGVGQKALLQELAKTPSIQGIPVLQLTQGDWGGTLNGLQQQQLKKVLQSHPEIANLPIDKAFPIANGVITGDWQSVSQEAIEKGLDLTGKELLKAIPELQNMPLGALPIDKLSIESLPGLADRPLETLPNVANKYVSELPGLSQTPLNKLPINLAINALKGDLFGRLDIAYAGPVETPVLNVATGGTKDQKFKPEPCTQKRCPHFELDNADGGGPPGSLSGRAWVEGKAQMVPGGKGLLAAVNGGKEPTGVPVWGVGEHVKLSLENIKEGQRQEESTAQVFMNIQVCYSAPFIGEQCTPHFISLPTPWKVKEGGLMLVASTNSPPDFIRQARDQAQSQYESQYGYEPECAPDVATPAIDPKLVATKGKAGGSIAQQNVQRYLARIAAGESNNGRNIGPNPTTGAYGEYQFTPESRATMIRRYGLDPWSKNKAVRDKAATVWIGLIGKEKGVDVVSAIQKGDFKLADRVLGPGQFTSLPGGAEQSSVWRNPMNLWRYGPAGKGVPELATGSTGCGPGGGPFAQGSGKATGRFKSPVSRPIVTSEFGPRSSPCAGCSSNHAGLDLGTAMNTPVKAPDGGRIDFSGWMSGYGNVVIIDHGNGLATMYAHLDRSKVRVGDKVSQGQVFALSGATGVGTGPHLHIEVYERYQSGNYRSGVPVNPRRHFRF